MEGRKAAWFLTLSGGIPFAACAILLWIIPPQDYLYGLTLRAMLVYAAVILSFLGGIRWGAALKGEEAVDDVTLALSVVPSLVGWVSTMLPSVFAFPLLAAAFLLQLVWDRAAAKSGAIPAWFGELRTVITAIVCVCLLVALFAIA